MQYDFVLDSSWSGCVFKLDPLIDFGLQPWSCNPTEQ